MKQVLSDVIDTFLPRESLSRKKYSQAPESNSKSTSIKNYRRMGAAIVHKTKSSLLLLFIDWGKIKTELMYINAS